MPTPGPSRALKLFGTEEPVPETFALRAGPLEATLDGGNLRHIRLHGREAIRAISFIVRDRDWGTYAPRLSRLEIAQDEGGFRVGYDAVCEDAQQAFGYRADIVADARGWLSFKVEGEASSDFVTNRAGFVVLHGLEGVRGASVEVEHVDGRRRRHRFPDLVDPACPLTDIRALTHGVLPGVSVTCCMEGDAYEMEDQRNWTDASYKTYVRPLSRPWPYTIARGERSAQEVTLAVSGGSAPAAPAGSGVTVAVAAEGVGPMPLVGLAAPANHVDAALERAELLRRVRPAYLVAEFDPRLGHGAGLLKRQAELARRLGAELVLEAVLPCSDRDGRPSDDPAVLARDLALLRQTAERAGAMPARLAVCPACDLKSWQPGAPRPPAPGWHDLAAAARAAFPGIPVGGGTFSYFTELNRKRPPPGLFDFVGHGTCPIVHAADDASLTESLEALPSVFASTAAFAGATPYWLFPTAISMRANPYGAGPAANPGGGRVAMARADPRERALIGAAWYAGYLAHAARAGLAAVTLAAVAGPSGIVRAAGDAPQPWFDAAGAALYPSYHVLRGLAALRAATVLPCRVSAPREVQALAARLPSGELQLWLANLTAAERTVELAGLPPGPARVALMDESAFERLCLDADALVAGERPADTGVVHLAAHAVARLMVASPS